MWPIILLLIFKSRKPESRSEDLWILVSIGLSLVVFALTWISYWFFKFNIDDEQKLNIEKGLIQRQKISIPIKNIQAIHLRQSWLHRLLGLTELLIDSPGTQSAEANISLTKAQAIELKSYIFDMKAGLGSESLVVGEDASANARQFREDMLLFGLEPGDLIKLGISANHFRAFMILIAFAYGILQNIRQVSETSYTEASSQFLDLLFSNTMAGIVMLSIGVVLISILISFTRVILRYANFRINRRDNGFSIKTGLIETKEKVISLEKIQYVKWSANWLRQKMALYELQLVAIGEVVEDDMKVNIPITQVGWLHSLIAYYGISLRGSTDALRISNRYLAFRLIRFVLIPAAICIALSFWNLNFLWGLGLPAYWSISAYLFLKKAGLYLNDEQVHICKGNFGTEDYLLKWQKIQSVQIRQNIYQRRHHLATVVFSTATGAITMPFLNLADAQRLVNIALFKIESGK